MRGQEKGRGEGERAGREETPTWKKNDRIEVHVLVILVK
jgi:hypothetical protein